jgi:hypothetical protein
LLQNKRSSEVFGITDAMIGKNILSLFPIGRDSKIRGAILQALKGEYVHIAKHKAVTVIEHLNPSLYRYSTGVR